MLKYCGKGEQLLLLSTLFCYLMLDFYVQTRIRFSLRDKRLFEITEVEITRVDCILFLINLRVTNFRVSFAVEYIYHGINDFKKIICLRKSEVFVARNSVCNVNEKMAGHGRSMAYSVCHDPISINLLPYQLRVHIEKFYNSKNKIIMFIIPL